MWNDLTTPVKLRLAVYAVLMVGYALGKLVFKTP
jgi:hypothetical protein